MINVRDGEFTVVTHAGDNHLGGKLLDWAIVEELLIPAVTHEYRITDLSRRADSRRKDVNKLKLAAEAAKIQLSRSESTEIMLELQDDSGRTVEFEYDLARADVERLTEPYVVRSINLCRKALQESRLGPGDIEKTLLVGGPTLSPYLRERLADPRAGLGIELDHSRDPITAVARGAAVFAGGQRLESGATAAPPPAGGQYSVALEYRPVGPDIEPFVGGRVSGADTTGHAVEFVNAEAKPPWRSGPGSRCRRTGRSPRRCGPRSGSRWWRVSTTAPTATAGSAGWRCTPRRSPGTCRRAARSISRSGSTSPGWWSPAPTSRSWTRSSSM